MFTNDRIIFLQFDSFSRILFVFLGGVNITAFGAFQLNGGTAFAFFGHGNALPL